MPSAASVKPEKAHPSTEASGGIPPPAAGAADNSPIRQILVIIEHKIRNLEKRKSKLISYRDLQKSGKELNADQKVAVAKYDEVAQTLEFARDMCKQVTSIALSAERDAKKQAKKEAWMRTASETAKIRDSLLVLDCLVQMGSTPAREDFLKGANGAAKLTETDLKILDDLYPEVTPRHESNEEGTPAFPALVMKAAEHLYSIVDGKPKDILGTTYGHIKQIVSSVHESGYFDKTEMKVPVVEELTPEPSEPVEEVVPPLEEVQLSASIVYPPPPHTLPSPAPLATAPAPSPYPIHPLPTITLQEVEHAYFTQQYAQPRLPITEVIGSQNFYFLQDSEIDSPVATPQPVVQVSPPGPIPTQTFTNQNYMTLGSARVAPEPGVLPPQPHFPPAPPTDLPAFPPVPLPSRALPHLPLDRLMPQPVPHLLAHDTPSPREDLALAAVPPVSAPEPVAAIDDDWSESPDREDNPDKSRFQGDGDAQINRNRRFVRGPRRGQSNGFRGGRGANRQSGDGYQGRRDDGNQVRQNSDGYQGRQNSDGYQGHQSSDGYQGRQNSDSYQGRQNDSYQGRQNDSYQGRQNSDGYQGRQNNDSYQVRQNNGGYQGRPRDDNYNIRNNSRNRNGDNGNNHQNDNGGTREKYDSAHGGFQGGFKNRGRGGGQRGSFRGGAPRASRPPPQFASKQNSSAE